jgi:hypothetical protein
VKRASDHCDNGVGACGTSGDGAASGGCTLEALAVEASCRQGVVVRGARSSGVGVWGDPPRRRRRCRACGWESLSCCVIIFTLDRVLSSSALLVTCLCVVTRCRVVVVTMFLGGSYHDRDNPHSNKASHGS